MDSKISTSTSIAVWLPHHHQLTPSPSLPLPPLSICAGAEVGPPRPEGSPPLPGVHPHLPPAQQTARRHRDPAGVGGHVPLDWQVSLNSSSSSPPLCAVIYISSSKNFTSNIQSSTIFIFHFTLNILNVPDILKVRG